MPMKRNKNNIQLQIEYLPIEDLTPYEKNTKDHDSDDVDKIAKSILDLGMNDPIGIWGKDNLIVEGHGRLLACKELGFEKVPVIRLDHMTAKERREYAILHNKLTELSTWNDFLAEELADLPELTDIYDLDFSDIYGTDEEEQEEDTEPTEDNSYYGDERERTFNSTNLNDFDRGKCAGKYDMPVVRKTDHVPTDLISFNYMLSSEAYDKGIHFYIDDYQFERLWNNPHEYMGKLARFDCALTPDFSMYTEMPLAMQIWNVYRSRLIGQIMQSYGITVIPTLQWCREESFEFCFDGIEQGGTVSVSTIGVKQDPEATKLWIAGMDEALRRLKPKCVVVYGGDIGYEFPCEVVYISNHNSERFGKIKEKGD